MAQLGQRVPRFGFIVHALSRCFLFITNFVIFSLLLLEISLRSSTGAFSSGSISTCFASIENIFTRYLADATRPWNAN